MTMTGNLNMGKNSIKNLRDPSLGSDAGTKGYIDRNNALNVKYEGATADINMQQHKLTNLLDPRDPQDCATKKYVDDSLFTERLIGSYEHSNFNPTKDRTEVILYTTINLLSHPGRTLKIVITITYSFLLSSPDSRFTPGRDGPAYSDPQVSYATHLISAEPDNILGAQRSAEDKHSILPIYGVLAGSTKLLYYIWIKKFTATSSLLNFYLDSLGGSEQINAMSIQIYKSSA